MLNLKVPSLTRDVAVALKTHHVEDIIFGIHKIRLRALRKNVPPKLLKEIEDLNVVVLRKVENVG